MLHSHVSSNNVCKGDLWLLIICLAQGVYLKCPYLQLLAEVALHQALAHCL